MESSREELDVMSSGDCSQVHVQCVFSLLSLAAQRVGRFWIIYSKVLLRT